MAGSVGGALAAIGLLSLQLVHRHYLNTPVVLVASVAIFWLGAWLTGLVAPATTVDEPVEKDTP